MTRIFNLVTIFFKSLVNILVVILHLPGLFRVRKMGIRINGRIHVLGNGPSLKDDYPALLSDLSESDSIMVVNSFACTDYFEKLKPQYYILVDPAFFIETTDERIKGLQKSISDALILKTQWPLHLLLSHAARKSPFVKRLMENKNIVLDFIRVVPVYDGSESLNRLFYKYDLATPPFRNVLIAAIFFCIKMSPKEIVIWGADHSWHEDLVLGRDNVLYVKDKHFYEGNPKMMAHRNKFGEPIKVHEMFTILARALKIYHVLEAFSHLYNCRIVNKSSITWIDAFVRE